MNSPHVPVLLDEVLQAFADIKSGAIVDCTLGYGGHSSAILEQNQNVNLIACDQDEEAIKFSSERLKKFGQRAQIFKSKFSEILGKVEQGQIRGILADIGVSAKLCRISCNSSVLIRHIIPCLVINLFL